MHFFVNCLSKQISKFTVTMHQHLPYLPKSFLTTCMYMYLSAAGVRFTVNLSGKEQPVLPRDMIQRAWGLPSMQIDKYMDFNENGCCVIGGNKCLSVRKIMPIQIRKCFFYKTFPIICIQYIIGPSYSENLMQTLESCSLSVNLTNQGGLV